MLLVDSKVESTMRYLCISSVTLLPGAKPPNVSIGSWLRKNVYTTSVRGGIVSALSEKKAIGSVSRLDAHRIARRPGAVAIFEKVLDDGAAPGDGRQAYNLGDQIGLGLRIAVQNVPFAALFIVQHETDRNARSARPLGARTVAAI